MVVVARNKGSSYIVAEMSVAVCQSKIAKFRVIPYFARRKIDLPEGIMAIIDTDKEGLARIKALPDDEAIPDRTIMEKAQALHFSACLPEPWWEFAILHTVHLYNRTPVQQLQWKTPYELIHNQPPDVSHFCVFGCTAHVFLPEDVRSNKLVPKSELMIFLGYQDSVKGFIFMCLPNNILFTGATALFDKSLFPKCPEGRLRGFIPVEGIPTDDPTNEEPIPLEDGDDDLNQINPNPSISNQRNVDDQEHCETQGVGKNDEKGRLL